MTCELKKEMPRQLALPFIAHPIFVCHIIISYLKSIYIYKQKQKLLKNKKDKWIIVEVEFEPQNIIKNTLYTKIRL